MKDIKEVENFWENNPLFSGESSAKEGTEKFFKEHTKTVIEDCFSGKFDERCFPINLKNKTVLDLGCGPGFWVEQISKQNPKKIIACDLTQKAIDLAKKRCDFLSINNIEFVKGNAENLPFDDNKFDFINCQGVIHHTPDTQKAIQEIKRCLKSGGTFSVSVYYKNIFLKSWPIIKPVGKIITKLGGGLKGRGRENIFSLRNIDEIVRHYDGADNPIGKAYSRKSIFSLFKKSNLKVNKYFLHFFPKRALPFQINYLLHKFLDKNFGFMIYLTGQK